MTELCTLSIEEMQSGLAAKNFSSLELVEAHLSRIEGQRALNSFITVAADSARVEAKAADVERTTNPSGALGKPLLGVPIAIKDMILTNGLRTTCGSKILGNFIPPYDATVTAKLKGAGAVIVGKTNMDEFAMGSSSETSHFGATKNPWNPEFVPGGSSGGSAAAVAARLVPAALGTDTGGSIRQPASFCSVVGLKPTYGRVSRYGVVAYASSLDQVGAFARTAADCALMTEVIAGADPRDMTASRSPVPGYGAAIKKIVAQSKPLSGLRVGIPKEYFVAGLDSEVAATVKSAITKLEELGAAVVEVSLPHTELGIAAYYIIAPAEASSNLARYDGIRYGYRAEGTTSLHELYCRSRSEGFGAEVRRRIMVGAYVLSAGYYDAYYVQAQKVRTLIARDFRDAFQAHCDVIACPAAPTLPFKLGAKVDDPLAMYLEDAFTIPVNLAGLPGITFPCGFGKKGETSGLPIGLQVIGRPWEESRLLEVAAAYEAATAWHRQMPT